MAANAYHFITHWHLPSTCEEVSDILKNGEDLPRWWPSVYLKTVLLEQGDERGVGAVLDLYTKGWLPYTLRWKARVTEVNFARGFSLAAEGDFVGRGVWSFQPDGGGVLVTYDWKISAEKRLLRRLSLLMKPVFAANHRWAMRMGEESINLELRRRRAQTEEERARIPAPPGATFYWGKTASPPGPLS
ncbi:MAG: polyketide cyclase [Chloroflexi bacterium]|nr:MAG: polyketide cyclase [Chloroflexota bacterium]